MITNDPVSTLGGGVIQSFTRIKLAGFEETPSRVPRYRYLLIQTVLDEAINCSCFVYNQIPHPTRVVV